VTEKFHVRSAPVYGTRAIGTSAYAPGLTDWPGGGVVGMHGTNEPGLVPGRPSHGCIRLRNAAINRLYRLVPKGTPIEII
jgi:lipoprotein-anchoring transpeptidase ErfK/SrfK